MIQWSTAIYSVFFRLACPLAELLGLSLPLTPDMTGGVDVRVKPAPTPRPDQGPDALDILNPVSLLPRTGGGPKVTAREPIVPGPMGGVGVEPLTEPGALLVETEEGAVDGERGFVGLRACPSFSRRLTLDKIAALTAAAADTLSEAPVEDGRFGDPAIPLSASAAGDSTARVTMLAKLGPVFDDDPDPALDPVEPGKGGNEGVEMMVGDCLSARTEGGGLKLGGGRGRLLGR